MGEKGEKEKEKGWITDDRLYLLGITFFIVFIFLNSSSGFSYALGPLLVMAGFFAVFLIIAGVFDYFVKKSGNTIASGLALSFVISLFFGPEYVAVPLRVVLGFFGRFF